MTEEGMNIKRRGLMFIISAPSGTGKTTLAKLLLKADFHISSSISVTTRPIRVGEKDGEDYYFVHQEEFKDMVQEDKLLEYAEIFGHFYGTPRAAVEKYLARGEDVLFDIDWQGHRQLIGTARDDVTSVFLLPPSKQDLIERLTKRNQDSDDVIKLRIEKSNLEITHWHEYDYIIINKDLEESLQKLLSILRAERLRKERRIGLPLFIGDLLKQTI